MTQQSFALMALAEALPLEALIPEDYARYRPLVTEAVAFFLGGLPRERLEAIAGEQLALPAATPDEERISRALSHCPTLHKLGQVLAHDRRLPAALRHRLQRLESLPGRCHGGELQQLVSTRLGKAAPLQTASHTLAEGSVAVVVPFTSTEGSGVLKLLKPDIAERLDQELMLWEQLADYIELRQEALQLPPLPLRETLQAVARQLRQEVQLDVEQEHMQRARAQYHRRPGIRIPELFPWCTPQATVMTRLDGGKVTELADWSDTARRRLAARVVDALLAEPFWRPDADVLVHGDPHAGNLLLGQDHSLGLIDWSLAGELSRRQREGLVALVVGALLLDGAHMERALTALGGRIQSAKALQRMISDSLAPIAGGMLPGLRWVTQLLDRTAASAVFTYPPGLLLFRKALFTLEGVVADIAPAASVETPFIAAGMVRLWQEWPLRSLAGWEHRSSFGSHLANADLAALGFQSPTLAMRHWRDMVAGV